MNYFEIGSPEPERAKAFSGSLFDWAVGEPSPAAYSTVDGGKGGLWDTSGIGGASWAIFYVRSTLYRLRSRRRSASARPC